MTSEKFSKDNMGGDTTTQQTIAGGTYRNSFMRMLKSVNRDGSWTTALMALFTFIWFLLNLFL